MSSRKSSSRKSSSRKSSSRKSSSRKETYYFSYKNVKDIITHKSETSYVNRVIVPIYLTPNMSESIVGYYTAYNSHEIKNGKNNKIIQATITTPNGVILATSKLYVLDNTHSNYTTTIGKKVNLDGEFGSEYYKTNPQAVLTVLSKFNRKLTITHGK
jgi:hypothetical protein